MTSPLNSPIGTSIRSKLLSAAATFAFVPISLITISSGSWPSKLEVRLSPDSQCTNGPILHAKVAQTDLERSKGLSGRAHALAPDEAMLFIWPNAFARSFWMHDTLIPLSLFFFDSNSHLLSSHEMPVEPDPRHPMKFYTESGPVVAALEAPPGKSDLAASSGWKTLCIESFDPFTHVNR